MFRIVHVNSSNRIEGTVMQVWNHLPFAVDMLCLDGDGESFACGSAEPEQVTAAYNYSVHNHWLRFTTCVLDTYVLE